ncbi:hypothetical protein AB0M86_29865 [Streptomyces sp. NPDC051639]|uniref:hypothetical protein n=1 Tax=unclassified Streptomyces TaxID=2593676 RepID=UPI00225A7595|nr:hypothetical protein [Streptomyces sp. NBC_01571]MCX4581088.1 hypothetical protein [Streptomyces sp. NBC_01571]
MTGSPKSRAGVVQLWGGGRTEAARILAATMAPTDVWMSSGTGRPAMIWSTEEAGRVLCADRQEHGAAWRERAVGRQFVWAR